MLINGTFRFHAVGQGLFYSGMINREGGGTFSFVYDCGTESSMNSLHRKIDDFKDLLPYVRNGDKKKIDLLVISHMHDDHVNGLEYLLEDLAVDTVVMPYTDETISILARIESSDIYSKDEEFLSSFYKNPIEWFSQKEVHRIMLIGSPDNPQEYYRNGNNDNINHVRGNEVNDSIIVDGIISSKNVNGITVLNLKNDSSAKSTHFYWKFHFTNLGLNEKEDYKRTVHEFLSSKNKSLDDIFRDKNLRDALANRLKFVTPKGRIINRTSVVLTHEPILKNFDTFLTHPSETKYLHYYWHFIKYFRIEDDVAPRTILTGDIELNKKERILPIGTYADYYSVFQYPHHGSKKALPYYDISNLDCVVFCAGLDNRYHHPDNVKMDNSRSVFVNENNTFGYSVSIVTDR